MKPRINGWWRLWIVLSVCWAIAVAAAIGPSPNAFRSRIALTQVDTGAGKMTVVRIAFSRTLSEDQVKAEIEGPIGASLSKDPLSYKVQPVTWPYERYVRDRAVPDLMLACIVAVIPIVVVLLFGLAIAWVRKGFETHNGREGGA